MVDHYDFSELVPGDIIEYCRLDRLDLDINLVGQSASGDAPRCRILIMNEVCYDGRVNGNVNLRFEKSVREIDQADIVIELYGKEDRHTITNEHGDILENQMLRIDSLVLNDIDLIRSNILWNVGNYTMDLNEQKKAYFIEHGYDVGPTHSLDMYENGKWIIKLETPITSGFCKIKGFQDPTEKWPDPELMEEMLARITNIRKMEKELLDRSKEK